MEALIGAGINPEVVAEEDEDPAGAIVAMCRDRNVDVACIGTVGLGRFEGLLGSVSTKVARRAPCSVLLIRSQPD